MNTATEYKVQIVARSFAKAAWASDWYCQKITIFETLPNKGSKVLLVKNISSADYKDIKRRYNDTIEAIHIGIAEE